MALHQDTNTLEVRGINASTLEDTLISFFENSYRSGGGDIKESNRTNDVFTVTFEQPGVAKSVLSRDSLTLEGAKLTVAAWDGKTIEVCGIRSSTTKDAIELFFESKRYSGGDQVDKVQRKQENTFVTFATLGVAEKVIAMPSLTLEGATLTVRKANIPRQETITSGNVNTNEDYQETVPRPRGLTGQIHPTQALWNGKTIEVSGILTSTTDDTIELFFESKRCYGGTIEKMQRDKERKLAYVTFETPGVAEKVIASPNLTVDGATLTVKKATGHMSDVKQSESDRREQGAAQKRTPTSTSKGDSAVRIVKIVGFKSGTSRSIIEMFIENKSGNTVLESCDIDDESGVVVLEFKNPTGAAKLMSADKLELSGARLTVIPLNDVYAGLDRETCRPKAVKVSGIRSKTSKDLLELLFENRRHTGGGSIDYLEYDEGVDIAVITFKDADSASRVAQKSPLLIDGAQVQIKLMKPSMHLIDTQGPCEDDVFLLSGVSPVCTGDDVRTFFSTPDIECDLQQVVFTQEPGIALLQFSYPPPEFYSLRVLCVTRPLRGTMVSIQRVPQTRTLQVHNIGSMTKDTLQLYFENLRKSGGGHVSCVQVHAEDNYATVEMADNSTVKSILSRGTHSFGNQTLHVAALYDGIGIISPLQDPSKPGGWIPKGVLVTGLDERLAGFISKSASSQKLINSKMADVAAAVAWDTYSDTSRSVEVTCTLTYNTKNVQHLAKTWSHDAHTSFLDVLKKEFMHEDVDILQEAWEQFAECISHTKDLDPSKVVVEVDASACVVGVTGQTNEVQIVSVRLKKDHTNIQEELTRVSKFVKEVSELPLHCLNMLRATLFKSLQEEKFKDLKVFIDSNLRQIEFTGAPKDVASAKCTMFEICNAMKDKSLAMSGTLISLVNGSALKKHLLDQFRAKRICAVYDNEPANKALIVYALKDKDLTVAVETIKIETEEQSLPGDVANRSNIKKWRELVSNLESKHSGLLKIMEDNDCVIVSGAAEPSDEAVMEVKRFLEDNTVSEEFVELGYGVADYMKRFLEDKVNNTLKTTPHVTANVHTDSRCGIALSGYGNNLKKATENVKKLAGTVVCDHLVLDKPGMPKFIESETGKMSLKQLENDHHVVIVDEEKLSHRDAEGGRYVSDGSGVVGSKVCLPGGATIEVVQSDLTKFKAEAIVNAANGRLEHTGGLAFAISQAGGPAIQNECREHVMSNDRLTAGQVYVSTSGSLPCKKVIHAVGPKWRDGNSNEENQLYDATYESLLAAGSLGLLSVAFPALSCGIFKYPVKQATKTIITAVKEFLEDNQHTSVKMVSLVDQSGNMVRELNDSLGIVFGSSAVVPVQPGQDSPRTAAARQMPSSQHSRKTTTPVSDEMSTPEGVKLLLCKSALAKEKVDAIVNSTNSRLQLDEGFVSKSLLDKGGKTLQKECTQNAPSDIQPGDVVVTSGGKLKCTYVIHAVCCQWDGGAGRSEQVLRLLLRLSLYEAHEVNATSIAIPPIGVGRLRFDPHLVAIVMREEVFEFSKQNPATSLREVRFVVYHKDIPCIQAFEHVLHGSGPSRSLEGYGESHAPSREDDGLPTSSHRSTTSATTELKTPEGIKVKLHPSEIVNENVGAIVNSTNQQLQLDRGFVSKAILTKGGKSIQTECQQKAPNGIQFGEVVVTSGGKLSCKFVIHGVCSKWDGGNGSSEKILRKFLTNCFHEANNNKVTSLAIPPIGIGGLGFDAHFVASVMCDEVFQFSRRHPRTSLRDVRFVVYPKDSACIQAFQEVLFDNDSSTVRQQKKEQGRKRELLGARPKQHGGSQGHSHGGRSYGRSTPKQSITLIVFAESHTRIKRVKEAIVKLCTAQCADVVLDSKED